MGTGESGRWPAGNSVTVVGAGLLAVSTLLLAYGVATKLPAVRKASSEAAPA